MKETYVIVVPVDFSESTEILAEYAVYMAGKLSAAIHFVHVFSFRHFSDYYAGDVMLGAPYYLECEDELLSNAKSKMGDLVKMNRQEYPECTGLVITGDPVDEILEYARDKDADLIIISTHGLKGLEKILLGSVAERVVKRAHCPVLTMNPFKDLNFQMSSDEGQTGLEKSKGVAMELKEEFKNLVEKLKMERDEIHLKIHLGSMDAQKEFEQAEKKWCHVKTKAADIANDGKITSEELIAKSKIVGEELKETYKRISRRLSE